MVKVKTSAINDYNAAIVMQNGRVGTVRYYTKNGLTYVRAASNSRSTDNRTNAQMTQRLTFASLAALYSTLSNHLKGAFPNKAKNQSDYNAFMQANQGEGVYMTKQERAMGYSVALPVIVSSGKLTGVETTISGDKAVTSLNIGSLDADSATVATLSAAITSGNEGWNYGDQLTVVVLRQTGNYCRPLYARIVLSREDETPVSAYGNFTTQSECLAYGVNGDLCIGFVHSTPQGGMSLTKLVATDSMIEFINAYLTDEAFAAASSSYGTSIEKFLIPTKGIILGNSSIGSAVVKYTLTLEVSPVGGGTVSGGGKYAKDSSASIQATAASGYTFSRWSDGNTSASRSVVIDGNKTLTAIFTATTSGGDSGEEEGGGLGA